MEIILEEITAIALQIQQGRELELLLREAIVDARERLQTDRVLIYRLLENQSAVVAFESVGTEWTSMNGQLIDDPCLEAVWVERYRQGQITVIPDIYAGDLAPCHVKTLEGLQVRASLVVPILNQGDLWGWLVAHHCRSSCEWPPLVVQYLQQLALHLGIAIQYADLHRAHQCLEAELGQRPPGHSSGEAGMSVGSMETTTEIVDQKQSDLVVQESAERFRQLAQYAPVGIFLTDAVGCCTYVNDRWCQLTHCSAEQAVGKGWSQIIHSDDLALVLTEWQSSVQNGREFDLECRFRRPDGVTVWVMVQAAALTDQNSSVTGFIGTVHDISDRKQAESALQEREHYYAQILNSVQEMVFCKAPGSIVTYANQATCQYYGMSLEQLRGITDVPFNQPDFTQQYIQDDFHIFTTGEVVERLEEPNQRFDGEIRYFHTIKSPILNTEGQVSQIVGVSRDITALKQVEREAQVLRERLQFLLSVGPVLIYSCEPQGDFGCTFVSENVTALLGYTPADFLSKPDFWVKHLHPEDATRIITGLGVLFERGYHTHEYRFQHHDGHYCWVRDEMRLVRNEEGDAVEIVGYCALIGDRKAAEIALAESKQQYQHLVENSPDIIERFDLQLRYLYVSSVLTKITGIPTEVFLGKTCRELGMDERIVNGWEAAALALLATGQKQVIEFETSTLQGIRSFEMAIVPELSEQQTVESILCISRDVTDRKAAEVLLHQRAERERLLTAIAQNIRQTLDLDQILRTTVMEVRQLLQVDRVIIYRFAPDWGGVVIAESVAEGCQSILGMQITDTFFVELQEQTYQKGLITATDDVHTSHIAPCYREFLAQMQVRAKLVVPILQNHYLWGLLVAQHCRSPRHWEPWEIELQQQLAIQMAIAIQQSELYQQVQSLNTVLELQVQERTAQLQQALNFEALLKRITDRVRDSLDEGQILQTAVEELAKGLLVAACDTGIYDAEHTTSTITYEFTNTLAPAQGNTFEIATAPYPEIYSYLLSGQFCHFCNIVPNPLHCDQQLLSILAVPIVDDQGVLGDLWLFKSSHDVFNDQEVRLVQQVANQCAIALRQSRLYQAAQAQVKELERLSQLKDDFLNTVSHELRSPMSNIKMATQMLELSLNRMGVFSDNNAPISRYFRVLQEEEEREINLINDLLDLARLDAETESLNVTSVDLHCYVPHLAETFAERIRQQQQHLVIQIPTDLPPLSTDLPYLERILTELFHNACKYTPCGETITVSARSAPETLEIWVSNTGVEISPVECDRVFDKFYRIPNNDPWKHGGTGLGLALVKKLTERLGGNIRAESGGGQTTFIVEFGKGR